jgi:Leucine-rich repeat (LRR) protein
MKKTLLLLVQLLFTFFVQGQNVPLGQYDFYDGKYALQSQDNAYFFVDKSGKMVEKLGKWSEIKRDYSDFVKVKNDKKEDFLLDSLGKTYPTAYRLEDLNEKITALDLSKTHLDSFPKDILKNLQLEILLLNHNNLSELPKEISELKALTYLSLNNNQLNVLPKEIGELKALTKLNLSFNQLTALPQEIGELKALTNLDLENNPISEEEQERIKKLLPNCKIEFTKIDYAEKAANFFSTKDYQNTYIYQKKVASQNPSNYNTWFNLSFYALFVKEYKEAINAAKKTLEIVPTQVSVETNLVLGYLLDNQWSEAEKIYLKWKGKKFDEKDEKTCNETFLQDIADLEAAGITHPDFAKVRALLSQ